MKSITVHGLEEKVYKKIKESAQKKGLSLNKTIKILLEKALGIGGETEINNEEEFREFFNAWSEKDLKEFRSSLKEMDSIDQRDWQ
ncbi:hypothetical protein ACFLT9_06915 [Acidobacteriota bacterium]